MKCLFAILFVVFAVTTTTIHGRREDWEQYKNSHNKNYSSNGAIDGLRREIFRKKDEEIKKHNKNPNRKFKLAHSKFSDMTEEEKKSFHGLSNPPSTRLLQSMTSHLAVESRQLPPISLDYRNHTCLSAVKNQGACGSCWAFSAITPLEFAYCMKYSKTPVVLSEQHLVDCDANDNGCNGGWYTNAWYYHKYIARGAAKQQFYTYTATKATTCKFTTSMIGARVNTYAYVPANNSTAMQIALHKYGPLSVAIAVIAPFYSYAGGVYTDPTCDTMEVNHGVVVVGYGTLDGINYWVVRNSWGRTWGLGGYILMQRGVNKCKIENYAAFVVPV